MPPSECRCPEHFGDELGGHLPACPVGAWELHSLARHAMRRCGENGSTSALLKRALRWYVLTRGKRKRHVIPTLSVPPWERHASKDHRQPSEPRIGGGASRARDGGHREVAALRKGGPTGNTGVSPGS